MLARLAALAVFVTAAAALADDAGGDFDAATPDASVGIGGTDTNNQEMGDGTTNTVCAESRDCEQGFVCKNGKCAFAGTRTASCQGCGGVAGVFLLPLMAVWGVRRARLPRTHRR